MRDDAIAAQLRRALDAHETRLARERERVRRIDARRRHAVLAARLLGAPPADAAALVRRARARVDQWERGRLCSEHYVARWRTMLAGPVRRVASALLEYDEWVDALFQSSPWSFSLEPPAP